MLVQQHDLTNQIESITVNRLLDHGIAPEILNKLEFIEPELIKLLYMVGRIKSIGRSYTVKNQNLPNITMRKINRQ